jgi:hypothetical protein
MSVSAKVQRQLPLFIVLTFLLAVVLIVVLMTTSQKTKNTASEDLARQYSVYFLRHNALWKYGAGTAKELARGPFTHLFGESENGLIMLGFLQPSAPRQVAAYPEHNTLSLTTYDPANGRLRSIRTFTYVTDVVYQRVPGRFVLFGPANASQNPDDGWTTEVTTLSARGEKVISFREPQLFNTRVLDGGTIAFHELQDGTLLALKKTPESSRDRIYLELTPTGERRVRTMPFPQNTDHLYWYRDKPIVQIPSGDDQQQVIAYLRQNGATKTLFALPDLVVMRDLFDAFGATYLNGIIEAEQKDWPPCSRLYKVTSKGVTPIIGSVAGVWPTPDGFLYTEPLETCIHVRLWKTDMQGRHAQLITDDFTVDDHYKQPVAVRQR